LEVLDDVGQEQVQRRPPSHLRYRRRSAAHWHRTAR
jgi:hypothetical protein